VQEIDIRALSEIYDERDVYLSLYLPTASKQDLRDNELFILSRTKEIAKALDRELKGEFEKTLENISPYMASDPFPGERGRIIYASSMIGMLHVYRLPITPTQRKMVLDTSPYILPLSKLRDDHLEYGMLVMDSQSARFIVISSDQCTIVNESNIDLMNKHKKGGMSQARFNRLRMGAIHQFIMDVLGDMERFGHLDELRGLVIAGPGEAKKMLLSELPNSIKDKVMGVLDIDVDTNCSELVALGNELASKDETMRGIEALKDLRSAIMRGDPSAYGTIELIDALAEGRVDRLIVLKDVSIPGWICERCQRISPEVGPPKECPACGGPTSKVNVVEELVELAHRTRSEMEFVKVSPFLSSLGGIGAVLRY
jgi:peptide chain release factor subunit 1